MVTEVQISVLCHISLCQHNRIKQQLVPVVILPWDVSGRRTVNINDGFLLHNTSIFTLVPVSMKRSPSPRGRAENKNRVPCLNESFVQLILFSSSCWWIANESFDSQPVYLWNYWCLFPLLRGTNSFWKCYKLSSTVFLYRLTELRLTPL